MDSLGMDAASDSILQFQNHPLLKLCKPENDDLLYTGDTTFTLFAQLLDSTLQGDQVIFKYLNVQDMI